MPTRSTSKSITKKTPAKKTAAKSAKSTAKTKSSKISVGKVPKGVKDNLPTHAQKIYHDAYESAFKEYGKKANAHKVAWSAVEKSYHKDVEGKWVKGKGKSAKSKSTATSKRASTRSAKTTRRVHH